MPTPLCIGSSTHLSYILSWPTAVKFGGRIYWRIFRPWRGYNDVLRNGSWMILLLIINLVWFPFILILPLMMTFEMHDISFFLKSLLSPSEAFNILNFVSFTSSSGTRSSGVKLPHRYARTSPSRHFYFTRLPRLWNSLISLNLLSVFIPQALSTLKHHLWSHFFLLLMIPIPITDYRGVTKC